MSVCSSVFNSSDSDLHITVMSTNPRDSDENLQGQFLKPVSLPAVKMPDAPPVPVRVSLVAAQSRVGTVIGCPPTPAFSPSLTLGDRAGHFTSWGEAQPNSSYTFWGETQATSFPLYTSWGETQQSSPSYTSTKANVSIKVGKIF